MAAGHTKEEVKGRKGVKGELRRNVGEKEYKIGEAKETHVRTRNSWWARSTASSADAHLFQARLARSLNPHARLSLSLLRLRAGVGA